MEKKLMERTQWLVYVLGILYCVSPGEYSEIKGENQMIRNVLYTKGSSTQPYFYLHLLVSRIPSPLRYFWMRNKQNHLLVSTYVVCERLSVMHEPAGVVEILVQILQNTPILKYSFRIPPPEMKIVIDLGTLRLFSFRIPPPPTHTHTKIEI